MLVLDWNRRGGAVVLKWKRRGAALDLDWNRIGAAMDLDWNRRTAGERCSSWKYFFVVLRILGQSLTTYYI